MAAHLIDGDALAAELRARVEADAAELEAGGVTPGLATVLVGEDYAAEAYERRVRRLAEELGCRYVSERLAADAAAEAVSPVPGGVGPITDVTLLANTVQAAKLQARRREG